MFNETRIVSEPRVEEVIVRRHTYLFFEFGDDVSSQIVFSIVVIVLVVLLFVEAEGERIGSFVGGVEGVDEALAPDSVAFSVIVEPADSGDEVPGFLSDRVAEDDVAVFRSVRFTVFLKFSKPFVIELLFVPVVLGEELLRVRFPPAGRTSGAIPATIL